MIIWISGLSGSGKTYLADQITRNFSNRKFINLDGDHVRECFKINKLDLGYSLSERKIQVKRLRSIAKILDDQNINVIITAVYVNDSLIKSNRLLFSKYLHIHFDISIKTLKQLNYKNIYSNSNVIGVDIKKSKISLSNIIINKRLKKNQMLHIFKKINEII